MFFYYDNFTTIGLIIIGMIISMWASWYVNHTFNKYSNVENNRGYTGAEVAKKILTYSQIHDVDIQRIPGELTDNYNMQTKKLSLSDVVMDETSVAAISVAAHECGHAVQDKVSYFPLFLRARIVPLANFGANLSPFLIFLGMAFSWNQVLINIGLICFTFALLFQLVTLPVEFNASRRALAIMKEQRLVDEAQLPIARKVLTAAALTYVAAFLSTLLQFLRLILIANGRNRD